MADQYHIDPGQFSLERLRHILETSEALPGRKVLREKGYTKVMVTLRDVVLYTNIAKELPKLSEY